MMMIVALACWATSRFIPATGIAAPNLKVDRNIFASSVRLVRELDADRRLWTGGIAVGWFWLTGVVALALIPVIVRNRIGGDIGVETVITALFAIGIGCGSILPLLALIARGRIVRLPVPIAAIFIALFLIDLGRQTIRLPAAAADIDLTARSCLPRCGMRIALDIVLMALAGALLVVPAFTAVQAWAGEERRARVVAAVNILTALFMVAGSLVTAVLQTRFFGLSEPALIVGLGVMNIFAGIYFFIALPGRFAADTLAVLLRFFCRLKVQGSENLVAGGARAILAMSYRSHLDPLVLMALLPEKPLFVVDRQPVARWWIHMAFSATLFLSCAPEPSDTVRHVSAALDGGRRVVIFLDNRLNADRSLPQLYATAADLATEIGVPIVAARADGLEQKPFVLRPAATVGRSNHAEGPCGVRRTAAGAIGGRTLQSNDRSRFCRDAAR